MLGLAVSFLSVLFVLYKLRMRRVSAGKVKTHRQRSLATYLSYHVNGDNSIVMNNSYINLYEYIII